VARSTSGLGKSLAHRRLARRRCRRSRDRSPCWEKTDDFQIPRSRSRPIANTLGSTAKRPSRLISRSSIGFRPEHPGPRHHDERARVLIAMKGAGNRHARRDAMEPSCIPFSARMVLLRGDATRETVGRGEPRASGISRYAVAALLDQLVKEGLHR
jgi:hypothetical protein